MSDFRTSTAEQAGRFRARIVAAFPHHARELGHGKVFVLGLGAAIVVGSTMVGLTWASGSHTQTPQVRTSPVPSTVPGTCTVLLAGRTISMDVDRARTMTMVAGVATQVEAVPAQAARALDAALSGQSNYLPTVDQTLRLLALDDATPPSKESRSALEALRRPAALTCIFKADTEKAEKKGRNGLTPRADKVRTGILDAFGKLKTTGYGKDADPGDAVAKAGRALEFWPKDATLVDRETGWVMANWLVARGSAYRLHTVTFDDHTWRPASGWRAQPTARQRDSVLVVVEKGR